MTQNNAQYRRLPSALYFIVFVGFFSPAVSASPDDSEEAETVSTPKEVLLETIGPAPMTNEFRALATIQLDPQRSATISSRINGWITSVNALPGKKVSKGDTLATLDSIQLRDENNVVKQARAALNAASELLKRKQKMMAEEIIPRNDLTAATLAYQQAKAEFDAAQARQTLFGSNGKSASLSTITAPFSGTVLTTTARQEQAVTPADVLFTLSDLSTVLITANVPESQVRFLEPGATVRIQASAWPDETFSGQIVSTAGTLDSSSRTLATYIAVNNEDGRLKPEMQVTAYVRYSPPKPVISVPDSALTLMDGKSSVFVANGENKYQPVQVTTGKKGLDRTEITSGLKPGDRVVVNQTYDLKSRLLIAETAGGH
ncbi:efflux RND transporter periplasmic adaptor subunit [Buttiauxella sp. A2-C2_NF]|uniref:efflux RND transporter periplasmic adaptor subunit n=1 Tax=Buttiauxella ferragutiae TaxID=82989 RepID=UPI001E4E9C53|nr:efflux RND transporter periplasmic adaptor subunit [Buttiauxella ferragutiae]MCE0828953.1 efflux RND transporter periplasmic adaptor subunit [Buttiauxella ferragutiae]